MATISAVILKHHKKADGTWNVKFRVTHNQQSVYIDTPHFVSKAQLDKKGKLRQDYIIEYLAFDLNSYRKKISDIGISVKSMSAQEIKKHLTSDHETSIDFISFCRAYIETMKETTAQPFRTVTNSLVDFFRSKVVPINEINAVMLRKYEAYLRSERVMKRKNQFGKVFTITSPPLTDSGVSIHLSNLRILFNAARNHYNDEDRGIIRVAHYPFRKYKVIRRPESRKRSLTIGQVKEVMNAKPETGSRAELAKDLFMLSFYLCGMNAVDIYNLPPYTEIERLDYNRSKTKGKRRDQAYISVNIPEEAAPLLKKYAGKLRERYSNHLNLNKALSKGFESLGIEGLTFYHARHTFATLARNHCRFSKDDVAMALNHRSGASVTDIYIAPDWKIIDDVQAAVIALLKS